MAKRFLSPATLITKAVAKPLPFCLTGKLLQLLCLMADGNLKRARALLNFAVPTRQLPVGSRYLRLPHATSATAITNHQECVRGRIKSYCYHGPSAFTLDGPELWLPPVSDRKPSQAWLSRSRVDSCLKTRRCCAKATTLPVPSSRSEMGVL